MESSKSSKWLAEAATLQGKSFWILKIIKSSKKNQVKV